MNISPERSSGEVVYGTGPGSTGGMADESRVMSERVQHLAASIYKEFEKMIQKHDEDSVKVITSQKLCLVFTRKWENFISF